VQSRAKLRLAAAAGSCGQSWRSRLWSRRSGVRVPSLTPQGILQIASNYWLPDLTARLLGNNLGTTFLENSGRPPRECLATYRLPVLRRPLRGVGWITGTGTAARHARHEASPIRELGRRRGPLAEHACRLARARVRRRPRGDQVLSVHFPEPRSRSTRHCSTGAAGRPCETAAENDASVGAAGVGLDRRRGAHHRPWIVRGQSDGSWVCRASRCPRRCSPGSPAPRSWCAAASHGAESVGAGLQRHTRTFETAGHRSVYRPWARPGDAAAVPA
jgi:hypothetical protein